MQAQQVGKTSVCRWKEDRQAAFSVGGDDSLRSQLYFAIPKMDRRGIRGTWWVNPGRGGAINYKGDDDTRANCWISCFADWKAAAARGHDFANHTMKHLGAADYAEADREIGETARVIWRTNPRQRLQLFDRGGGTTWQITEEQLTGILNKYDCVQGRGGGTEDPTWEVNPNAETLRGYVDAAVREGTWHHVAFHGIGPNCEWGGPVAGDAFIALLNYLTEKRDQVWTGTHTEVHKYDQEYRTAAVTILEVSSLEIRLRLTSTMPTYLYNYPLTLRTKVPDSWGSVYVSQNHKSSERRALSGIIQFDAVPGEGDIKILHA